MSATENKHDYLSLVKRWVLPTATALFVFFLIFFLRGKFISLSSDAQVAQTTVTRQVAASVNDAHQRDDNKVFSSTALGVRMGKSDFANIRFTGGFRFVNITVPNGAIIDSAVFKCTIDSTRWDDPSVNIYGEKIANSADFAANKTVIRRTKTTSSVSWGATSLGAGLVQSPDIKSVIQEIVNQPGWNAGNALAVLIKGNSDTKDFHCFSFDGSANNAAGIEIAYHQQIPSPPPTERPNVIVIETDDQRWDTVDYMPTVKNRLVAEGVAFSNSFVTTSLCCPSRASFLTGRYAHNHGVWDNAPPNGGVTEFQDSSTLATWLKGGGYTTSFIGKYLNGYPGISPYIPPGWDDWHASLKRYNSVFNDNGVINSYSDYSTDVMRDLAISFIDRAQKPFFLWLTPHAPHADGRYPKPPIVAPRHANSCEGLPLHRPVSFNEEDVSDKPTFVKNTPLMSELQIAELDTFRKAQICSLKAVDEAIAAILDSLGTELDNTVIIFTSDNGYLWGEHRLAQKDKSYEESIRVPLVIRYPMLIAAGQTNSKLVLNIDLAPTIAALAGVNVPTNVNGRSLLPLFTSPANSWRDAVLIEHRMTKFGVRTERYKYVDYTDTGEKEFYDLALDPFELDNAVNNSSYATVISDLANRLGLLKNE